jgi:peptidoglycan/LPS O-acetylase OafA/YrhL
LFIPNWFEFFIGAVLFLLWRRQVSRALLAAYLGVLLAFLVADVPTSNEIAAVTTATVLLIALMFWYAAESGAIGSWLRSAPLRYLGDISYSLYLMHAVLGIRLLKLWVHPGDGALRAWTMFAAALLISVLAADLMFRMIERPSMRFSRRLKWRTS